MCEGTENILRDDTEELFLDVILQRSLFHCIGKDVIQELIELHDVGLGQNPQTVEVHEHFEVDAR